MGLNQFHPKKQNPTLTVQLESRECIGCSRGFKVTSISPVVWCSMACKEHCETDPELKKKMVKARLLGPVAGIFIAKGGPYSKDKKPAPVELKLAEEPLEEETALKVQNLKKKPAKTVQSVQKSEEEMWQSYVDRARNIVGKISTHRLEIATLAIEACDIKHGGGSHWSKFKGIYTIKRFAEDIGVCAKTLSNWVRVKQNVIDHLPEGEYTENDWSAAQRASDRLKKGTHPELIKRAFNEWKDKKDPNHYLLQGIRRMRSTAYFLEKKADFSKIDPAHMKELASISKKIYDLTRGKK